MVGFGLFVQPQPFAVLGSSFVAVSSCQVGRRPVYGSEVFLRAEGWFQLSAMSREGAASSSHRGGRAASAARAEGGKGTGKGAEDDRLYWIGKALTSMLRHGNHGAREHLSSVGWAAVRALCRLRYLKNMGAEPDDVLEVVRRQDRRKRRFETYADSDGVVFIRAVQGHSDDSGVTAEHVNPEVDFHDLPEYLIHATFKRHMDAILRDGLLAGGERGTKHRQQVHYVDGFPTPHDVARGIRGGAEIGVVISPSEYASAGGRFQKTPQLVGGEKYGCYLSGSVPPRFITMVRDLRTKDILYARDEARPDARSGLPRPATTAPAAGSDVSSSSAAAARPVPAATKAAPKVKAKAKQGRTPSPEPLEEELKGIPWFKECYDIRLSVARDEPWVKGQAEYVRKCLQLHSGNELAFYRRQCKHYGVAPASSPYSDQFRHGPSPAAAEIAKSRAEALAIKAAKSSPAGKWLAEAQAGPAAASSSAAAESTEKKVESVCEAVRQALSEGVVTGQLGVVLEANPKDPSSSAEVADPREAKKKGEFEEVVVEEVEEFPPPEQGSLTKKKVKEEGAKGTAAVESAPAKRGSDVAEEGQPATKREKSKADEPSSFLTKLQSSLETYLQVKPKLEDLVPESALEEETRRVKEVAAKEDQGSEVDWGSEGESESSEDEDGEPTKEEEEGKEVPIVAPAASEPAAEPSVSPASAAENPLRELSSEELKMIGIWTARPVGCQRAMEHWLLAAHRRMEKQAATKEGEKRILEANLTAITNQEITEEVLARLLGGQLTQEEEDAVARLERSQSREAVLARAARLHALRRMLDHASTAGDILEARLHSTGNLKEVLEAFDKTEAMRVVDEEARDAVFRREIAAVQAGTSSKTMAQVVRAARKRLRAKKHRIAACERMNREVTKALNAQVNAGTRDQRLMSNAVWKVEDNLDELEYAPGTWWCSRCYGISTGESGCTNYYRGNQCTGSFGKTFHSWARAHTGTDLVRAPRQRRVANIREKVAEDLKKSGWECNRCGAQNLAQRDKCYRCSYSISQKQRSDLQDERELLQAQGEDLVPKRTAKRGGAKRKKNPSAPSAPTNESGGTGVRGEHAVSASRATPATSASDARDRSPRREPREDDWRWTDDSRDWNWSGWQGGWESQDWGNDDEGWYGGGSRHRRSRRKLPRRGFVAPVYGAALRAPEVLEKEERPADSVFVAEGRSAVWGASVDRTGSLGRRVWSCLSFLPSVVWGCLWSLGRVVRNRLAHALNGNTMLAMPFGHGPAHYWLMYLTLSIVGYRVGEIGLRVGEMGLRVGEELVEAVEEIVEATSFEVRETIHWIGFAARVAGAVMVWFMARSLWSKLMHIIYGNVEVPSTTKDVAWKYLLKDGNVSRRPTGLSSRLGDDGTEIIYQVEGTNGGSYKVILHLTDRAKCRCSCKAFIFTGKACKHLVEIARLEDSTVGVVSSSQPALEVVRPDAAAARGRAALGIKPEVPVLGGQSPGCMDGLGLTTLMQKAASIRSQGYGKGLPDSTSLEESQQPARSPERVDAGSSADTPLQGIKKNKELPKEVVRVLSPAVRPAEPEPAVKFVPNFTSQEILVDRLKSWPKCEVTMVAYSFDQPLVVEALEAHEGKVRLLADQSQTNGKTKQQYQVLLRLQRAGCVVKVGSGSSVRAAYLADKREIAAMGHSIRGIIHGKGCLLVEGRRALSLVGSCNWTTSSKSSLEFGVQVELDAESEFVKDYLAHFEGTWAHAAHLDSLSQDPEARRNMRNKLPPSEAPK